jgi:hypothetical protein
MGYRVPTLPPEPETNLNGRFSGIPERGSSGGSEKGVGVGRAAPSLKFFQLLACDLSGEG